MVSTRGGARTDIEEADMALKKRPGRKVTAKPAATAAPKAKATRAKKAAPEPEAEMVEDDEDELAQPAPAPIKLAARRGRPPFRKDEEPAKRETTLKTTTKATSAPKAAVKTTRAANTRKAKAKGSEEEQAESSNSQAPELKPPQPRATRPTRATAAKEKAAPLSPKKITQVSKAPVRKATNAKPTMLKSAPAKPAKPVARGRPALRKRNVSDENAGIPPLKPGVGADEEQNYAKLMESTNAKTSRKPSSSPALLEGEPPMSTRPTTPTDLAQQTMDEPELETNEAQDEESEAELQEEADDSSDDELCAPKTPMRRCDPREQARYSPAKGIQQPDVEISLKTPMRRFHVLGTQQGTPQTQMPYCKPTLPISEVRPTTVARAHSRAMVFPKLQALRAADNPSGEGAHATQREHKSLPGDRPDMTVDDAEALEEQDSDMSLLVDESIRNISIADVDVTVVTHDDTPKEHPAPDPEETIVDEQIDEEEFMSPRDASVDNVLITGWETEGESEDESVEATGTRGTPRAETVAWEPLQDDIAIPFNFDGDASPIRTLPKVEATQHYEIAAISTNREASNDDARAEATRKSSIVEIAFNPSLSMPRLSINDVRESLDATVNISDFVHASSFAERDLEQIENGVDVVEADVNNIMVKKSTVEDIADDANSVVDGDMTLACDEPSTPLPVTRTPIRLTTVEDISEESATMDGDVTLILAEPTCPTTVKRSPVKLATAEEVFEDEESMEGDVTLAIDEPTCPRTVKRSPIRLTSAEDVPEEIETVEGNLTLMLDSPLPQQPETPVLLDDSRDSNVTPLDLEAVATPRYARSTISSRRKSVSESSRPRTADGERMPLNTQPAAEAWFDKTASPAKGANRVSSNSTDRSSRSRSRSLSRPRTPAARTPAAVRSATKERFPGMPPAESYEELLNSPTAKNSSAVQTPSKKTSVTRPASHKRKSTHGEEEDEMPDMATPQRALPERFPGMPSRSVYEAHTAMPMTRFRTPTRKSPAKRPATTHKPTSLRKIALKAASTPMKAPLKAPAETPGQVPMTPHPAAPLRNVVALVDVYTHDGICASQSFAVLLKRLGAKTTKTFNENVTHVVYKEGGPKVLQALKIHNKQIAESGKGQEIFCVNSRWVNDCDAQGRRMPEFDEEYAVELDDYQRTAKRRRKSMEPMGLLKTNGGNIIRDRKSGAGRVSIGRASMKGVFDSPEESSMMFDSADKENTEDEPATPDYLKDPSALLQQTVPANRVRKLDLGHDSKRRRLTYADGLEF